jgi:putative metallohydrolase (TIGR04338 family)
MAAAVAAKAARPPVMLVLVEIEKLLIIERLEYQMVFIARRGPWESQRARLYAAEDQVKASLRDPLPTIAEMQAFVDGMLRSRWMQNYFGSRMLTPVTVVGKRRWNQRGANAHFFRSEISMSKELRSKFVVIHEVCHILTERFHGQNMTEAHGREFATFELMLVNHFLGAEDCQDLLEAFARNGVAHSYRREGK